MMSSTTTPTPAAFGAALRTIRQSVTLSQSKFAEYLDVDHSYVSRLESGSRMPSRQFVERVIRDCGLHGAEADQLLLGAGFAPSTALAIEGEPEVAALLHMLADPRTPDSWRVMVRGILRSLRNGVPAQEGEAA